MGSIFEKSAKCVTYFIISHVVFQHVSLCMLTFPCTPGLFFTIPTQLREQYRSKLRYFDTYQVVLFLICNTSFFVLYCQSTDTSGDIVNYQKAADRYSFQPDS